MVFDANQSPVANATVNGPWSAGNTDPITCTTDSTGQCSLTSDQVKQNQTEVLTFTISDINHPSLTYQATDNTDPDSDGTSITLNPPQ